MCACGNGCGRALGRSAGACLKQTALHLTDKTDSAPPHRHKRQTALHQRDNSRPPQSQPQNNKHTQRALWVCVLARTRCVCVRAHAPCVCVWAVYYIQIRKSEQRPPLHLVCVCVCVRARARVFHWVHACIMHACTHACMYACMLESCMHVCMHALNM